MRCWIGIGSNLGDRLRNLEDAAKHLLQAKDLKLLQAGPVFETKALVESSAPDDWKKRYLNSVMEVETDRDPENLLVTLKRIEDAMGREASRKWAPRLIDLDLLVHGSHALTTPHCQVPHPEISKRSFVLGPLKHLCPSLRWPGSVGSALEQARLLPEQNPLWLGILNLTPDSFSDGGKLSKPEALLSQIEELDGNFVQAIELGGESTRPGATPISPGLEWERIENALQLLRLRYAGRFFRPWISVDTRHSSTAAKALDLGAIVINDVSGLADPAMIDVIRSQSCQYVLMHSLSVPADKNLVLEEGIDVIAAVKSWAMRKLDQLDTSGVNSNRIIFDPGIGFGKTAVQSLRILERSQELLDLPVRVMIGHSRKSFMASWSGVQPNRRDSFSIGSSIALANKGIDILRVHAAAQHSQAFSGFQEVRT